MSVASRLILIRTSSRVGETTPSVRENRENNERNNEMFWNFAATQQADSSFHGAIDERPAASQAINVGS